MVDTRNGQTVSFIKFEKGVEEIFAVQVLHGLRYPDIREWDAKRWEDPYIARIIVLPDEAVKEMDDQWM